jgi:hypothetical protein
MNNIKIQVSIAETPLLLELLKKFDVKVVEITPDNKSDVEEEHDAVYWLERIAQRGDITKAIPDPSAWQREIRSWDKVLHRREG